MRGIALTGLAAAAVLCWTPRVEATPTIGTTPGSIATDATGSVMIDVGNLAGGSVILRLRVDGNGNGSIDAGDEAIWTHVIPDNTPLWSPAMPSDQDPTVGAISVSLSHFAPFEFPYSAGTFLWEAEDTFDASTQTVPFTVTQTPQAQSASGTVTDASNSQPIPGALAILLQFCDGGEEADRLYSAFTDGSGQYAIQLPAALDCYRRIVLAIKPGYVSDLLGQPLLTFTGASTFTNQDVELTPGVHTVDGSVLYASGPEAGNGIPGVLMFADGQGFPTASVAFADENGDYAFALTDGDWQIGAPEGGLGERGAVRVDQGEALTVSGTGVTVPTFSIPATNAYLQGTLTDDVGTPLGGRFVAADEIQPCTPDCTRAGAVTAADGSFTLGVHAPTGPAQGEYTLSIEDPLPDQVAEQQGCLFLSEGGTQAGITLQHVTPTGFVTGTVVDAAGTPTPGFCVDAWAFPGGGCTAYRSGAVSGCDGGYSLPVVDADWGLELSIDGLASLYGDYSTTPAFRSLSLPGDDPKGNDFILGPSRLRPHVVSVEPTDPQPGERVLIEGYGFSLGTAPSVAFGATPATVVDFRPDLGFLFVDVPGGLAAGTSDLVVTNNDTGVSSDPYCVDVASGTFTPACTIGGTTTDGGGALAGVTLVAVDDVTGRIAGHAVSDGSGNYGIGLRAAGDYRVFMAPPEGNQLAWANYVVTCGNMQSHLFATGFEITGRVVTPTSDPAEGATVQIEDAGGYYARVSSDENGDWLLVAPAGTYDFSFDAPHGGRILDAPGFTTPIAGNADLGTNTAAIGSFFAGAVVDAAGDGVPAQVIGVDGSFQRSGDAHTRSCDGRFAVGLPDGQHDLILEDLGAGLFRSSQVKSVDVAGDTIAAFDFTVFDAAVNPTPGPEPQILFVEPEPAGQAGRPLLIDASNLAGTTVEVLFSDGLGGFVAGTGTEVEPERGLVVTRIPAAAADGALKVRVDGTDSDEVSFRRVAGTFSPGTFSVDGTISGPGNAGALVALAVQGAGGTSCDDGFEITDYGRADGGGNYGPLNHYGGDLEVFVVPDAATMGVNASEVRPAAMSNMTVDVTVPTGVAVSATVVDAFASPVPGAILEIGRDQRRTDGAGQATVPANPGDNEVNAIPPRGLRLLEYADVTTVAGPVDLGNLVLDDGAVASSVVLREADGAPLPGVTVSGARNEAPFDFFFDTRTRADGSFFGPIATDAGFRLRAEIDDDTLTDVGRADTSGPDRDCILYPPFESLAAGVVAGLVRDAGSLMPLADIVALGFQNNMGLPGNVTGFGQTCVDGTYALKMPAGSHLLRLFDSPSNQYSTWYDDAWCLAGATPLAVTVGNTTVANADLEQLGSISGVVSTSGVPTPGVTVCATSTNQGGCQTCSAPTDAGGAYQITLPPETDYRVEAFSMLGSQCYDGFPFCSGFTPVAVASGIDSGGIDFDFCGTPDGDGDGITVCDGDCEDGDINVYPGAPEINDGIDNQCPGDFGHGFVDELSGSAGFFNPADKHEFSWPAQAGASTYELARSDRADFGRPGMTLLTGATQFSEVATPAAGGVFHYLARPVAPLAGGWGPSPAGTRGVNVIDDSDLESWLNPGNLTTWFEATAAGTVEQETNPADVQEQLYAARLTRTGAGALNIQKRMVSLQPGFDHALVLQAKFDQVFGTPLYVRIFNFTTGEDLQPDGFTWAAGVNSFFFDLSTGYQEVLLPFSVDPGFSTADDIRVIVGHRGGTPNASILWLDDVRVEER